MPILGIEERRLFFTCINYVPVRFQKLAEKYEIYCQRDCTNA